VELVLDKASEGRLKTLCTLAAKLWSEVNSVMIPSLHSMSVKVVKG
jgi:hypothetical protein